MAPSKTISTPPSDQRINIRMSKMARALQTASARTNWAEMAKMLFRADPDQARQDEARRLRLLPLASELATHGTASYGTDQFHYVLVLLLIVSIAEKRTQDLYDRKFAQRCDTISKTYGLKDDQYWTDGKAPADWDALNKEFEQESLRILMDVLREYDQKEIATLVESEGLEQFYSIIQGIRSQFLKVLDLSLPQTERLKDHYDSIPEMLQPSLNRRKV